MRYPSPNHCCFAQSYAKAISEVRAVLVVVYREAHPTQDIAAVAQARASAAAEAFAGTDLSRRKFENLTFVMCLATYTEVHATVVSNGEGTEGCARVEAEAAAAARAFAEVMVTAVSGIRRETELKFVRVASQSYYAGLYSEVGSICTVGFCHVCIFRPSLPPPLVPVLRERRMSTLTRTHSPLLFRRLSSRHSPRLLHSPTTEVRRIKNLTNSSGGVCRSTWRDHRSHRWRLRSE